MEREEAEHFAKSKNLYYMECSAKEGQNISGIFEQTASNIYDKLETGQIDLDTGYDYYGIKYGLGNSKRQVGTNSSRTSQIGPDYISKSKKKRGCCR